jgi:hypothetical protein
MVDGPPRNVRALLARLRNHCRTTELDQPRVQRHLAMMVVAQLLDGAVIKGGRNLEVRYGLRATRASTDLDVTRAVPLPAFLDQLDAALAAGWQGFTATMRERGPIAAPVPQDRRPYQVDIVTHYRGATGIGTVRLEVVSEEVDPPVPPDVVESRDATDLFAALGLRPPAPVRVLPLAHQIAQKIHACTAPDDPASGRVTAVVLGELGSPTWLPARPPGADRPENAEFGAGGGNRTRDHPLTRRALYRLSYPGVARTLPPSIRAERPDAGAEEVTRWEFHRCGSLPRGHRREPPWSTSTPPPS